ncbi:MAG: DUF1800 family protein, partial [Ferruginibacter sp.]
MGSPLLTRKDFFRSLTLQKGSPDPTDPLFEKYSRKSSGPRVFSNALVSYFRQGAERRSAAGEELRVGNVTSGLTPYTGTWGTPEALHLLRRTGFGFKISDAQTLSAAGTAGAAVDMVLNISAVPSPPPVNWYNNLAADAGGIAYGADWTNNPSPYIDAATATLQQTSNRYRIDAQRRWMYGLSLNQDITIREKMMWFWYHFIPIDFESIFQSSNSYVSTNSARIFYSYMKLFRDNPFGNFKTLIRNISTHPSMMFYLNNQVNSANAPDENFARELMELFTLGKDPLTKNTQADVKAAAQL